MLRMDIYWHTSSIITNSNISIFRDVRRGCRVAVDGVRLLSSGRDGAFPPRPVPPDVRRHVPGGRRHPAALERVHHGARVLRPAPLRAAVRARGGRRVRVRVRDDLHGRQRPRAGAAQASCMHA